MKSTKWLFKLILLIYVTGFSVLAVADTTIEIVNGRPVRHGENYSQHTVGLGQSEIMCSGVIIDSRHVITAAHCLNEVANGKVYFGTSQENFVFRAVIAATAHPDYCKNSCGTLFSYDDNDILLLEFVGGLPPGFSPVPIAERNSFGSASTVQLAGFGANEKNKYEDILKVAAVPFTKFVGQSEFQTEETSAGSCSGDSGGPAFVTVGGELQLAGITSRGDSACRSFGIYTTVSYFSSWIAEVLKK